jgi:2'-5' RNA ligase
MKRSQMMQTQLMTTTLTQGNPGLKLKMATSVHRLFFGAKVVAPWPHDYPGGRMIAEELRHVTIAFLGTVPLPRLLDLLPSAPLPPFQIGPAGIGDRLLFLPPEKERVAALCIRWLESPPPFDAYQKIFSNWLQEKGYPPDERPWLPHITVARAPLDREEWQRHFTSLPFFIQGIHLYRSVGNLEYNSLWEIPLLAPFEEKEHTADIAFVVRGKTPQELHQHAQLALSFKFPMLFPFFSKNLQNSLDAIIIALNEMVGIADAACGCPLKAISFHGQIKEDADHLLHWEMIVDV